MTDEYKIYTIKKPLYFRIIKRLFDLLFSIFVLAIGLVPSLIICIIIICYDGHFPFFKEKRMVRIDKEINIGKFRTMVGDAQNFNKYFTKEQLDKGRKEHKLENDPRITKIGRFLRSTSLDEFPQFIHVFTGHLSTIGPRVITKDELKFYKKNDRFKLLSLRPGITGAWQVDFKENTSYFNGERQKLELSYIDNASIIYDIRIIFKTIKVIILKKNM